MPPSSRVREEAVGSVPNCPYCCPSESHPECGQTVLYWEAAETPHQVPAARSQRHFHPRSALHQFPSPPGPGRCVVGKVVSVSPFPTSSSLPVSIPISLPHQLTVPRLGTMASRLKVNSPGGISSSCQLIRCSSPGSGSGAHQKCNSGSQTRWHRWPRDAGAVSRVGPQPLPGASGVLESGCCLAEMYHL